MNNFLVAVQVICLVVNQLLAEQVTQLVSHSFSVAD